MSLTFSFGINHLDDDLDDDLAGIAAIVCRVITMEVNQKQPLEFNSTLFFSLQPFQVSIESPTHVAQLAYCVAFDVGRFSGERLLCSPHPAAVGGNKFSTIREPDSLSVDIQLHLTLINSHFLSNLFANIFPTSCH